MEIVEAAWVDDVVSHKYIDNLRKYLKQQKGFNFTEPMWNDRLTSHGVETQFYRPFVIFDYDANKKIQKCFSFSHYKANPTHLEEFPIPGYGQIRLDCPIEVPTQYLCIFNFKHEIEKEKKSLDRWQVIEKLENLNAEFRGLKRVKDYAIDQYEAIRYGRNIQNKKWRDQLIDNLKYSNISLFDAISNAHYKMINEKQVHEFCLNELKSLE